MESVIVPNKMDRRMKGRVTPDVLIAHYEIVANIFVRLYVMSFKEKQYRVRLFQPSLSLSI